MSPYLKWQTHLNDLHFEAASRGIGRYPEQLRRCPRCCSFGGQKLGETFWSGLNRGASRERCYRQCSRSLWFSHHQWSHFVAGHLMLYRSDSSQAISRSLFTFAAQNLPLQDFLGCHSEHCHQVGDEVFLFSFPLEVISSYLQMWNPIIQWLAFVFPINIAILMYSPFWGKAVWNHDLECAGR